MAELETLQERLSAAEKRIVFYDKIMWLSGALLIIFGGSGAFGLNLLIDANKQLNSLEKRTNSLEESLERWEVKVRGAIHEVETTTKESVRNIRTQVKSLKGEAIKKISGQAENSKSSLEKLVKDLEMQMKKLAKGLMAELKNSGSRFFATKKELSGLSSGIKEKVKRNSNVIRDVKQMGSESFATKRQVEKLTKNLKNGELSLSVRRLRVKNSSGKTAVDLGTDGDDEGYVDIYNKQGKPSLELLVAKGGEGEIQVNNSKGGTRARLYSSDSFGYFRLYSNHGDKFLNIGMYTNDETPFIELIEPVSGETAVLLSKQSSGDGYLKLYSLSGGRNKTIYPSR